MAQPSITGGILKTSLTEMNIGDYISCEYVASVANTAGTFANLGVATKAEIPVTGTTTPNGTFYFIKADKGLLIADRVIQTGVSWDVLNGAKYIEGIKNLGIFNKIPTMTSNTTPEGIATTSSGLYRPVGHDYGPWRAFMNTVDTTSGYNYCWHLDAGITSGWLGYEFASPQIITSYDITPQNDFTGRTPRTWTFEGYNGTTWVVLDTRTNITSWTNLVANSYSFSNSTAYTKYRINISAGNSSYITIGNMKMYSNQYKIRSLTGGIASNEINNNPVILNREIGNYPNNNEWDKYIVKSTLGGKITAGSNITWNWANGDNYSGSWTQDTLSSAYGVTSNKIIRGYGSGRSFNATSDRITFSAKVIPNGNKTITFKFKGNSSPNGGTILSTGILDTDASQFLMSMGSSGKISVSLRKYTVAIYMHSTLNSVLDNLWHEIKFVQDETNKKVSFYIDNVLDSTANYLSNDFDNVVYSRNLVIGASYASASTYNSYFKGELTQLKIIDGNGINVLYLPMDETSGNLNDQSGNGYTGTVTGTTVIQKAKLNGSTAQATTTITSGLAGFRPVLEYIE